MRYWRCNQGSGDVLSVCVTLQLRELDTQGRKYQVSKRSVCQHADQGISSGGAPSPSKLLIMASAKFCIELCTSLWTLPPPPPLVRSCIRPSLYTLIRFPNLSKITFSASSGPPLFNGYYCVEKMINSNTSLMRRLNTSLTRPLVCSLHL